ncbi:MAG: zinc-ribbon domain-containing protein [Rickettsiales bacterium]|jgi:predicted Zn finger-like uncharacterized protein|nr:zinc-ribbon domain-containing protein [Rickettsiales bacterium]
MIILCPKCKTKFVIKENSKETLIGKKAKCCSCETVWNIDETSFFQEPHNQISIDINDLRIPIPPSVNNNKEVFEDVEEIIGKTQTPELKEEIKPKKHFFKKHKKKFIIGAFVVAYIILMILILKYVFKSEPEEDFYIKLTTTEITNSQIKTSGKIVNKTENLHSIPKILVLFLSEKDEVISRKTVKSDEKIIQSNATLDFSFTFPYLDYNIKKVKIYFSK